MELVLATPAGTEAFTNVFLNHTRLPTLDHLVADQFASEPSLAPQNIVYITGRKSPNVHSKSLLLRFIIMHLDINTSSSRGS